ncbi:hypothetical protein GF323_04260 [Candidatus Woesearchaeota archaeon]|nr:hypothetical protein [Candidatus Woesearchaeota archaeon]
MRYLLELSKENLDLSKEEALSLIKEKHPILLDNFLLISSNKKELDFISCRLAFTKGIYRILFLCMEKNLNSYLNKFRWNGIYKKDFRVRLHYKSKISEKETASIVWKKISKPTVNLDNPETNIHIFKLKDRVFCTLLERELKQDYSSRKAHKRPVLHPSSLHPKLAKALINLTGMKKGRIVDPFCGSGGILIEAGLMGLNPVGYDIDQVMLNRAEINLKYFGINGFKLIKKDALKIKRKCEYIATDLPYGRNTRSGELRDLFSCFLSNLREILGKRAVIAFPVFKGRNINYSRLIKNSGFKIIHKFDHYLHSSLSKRIFVIS